jgi:hypothetical protein
VPAAEAVAGEELAPAGPREAKDMLEVRRGSGERPADSRIERSAHGGEEQDCSDARADLEAAVGDVLVRHPVSREVEQQPERQRAESRIDERAAGRTGGDVEGNDQAATLACWALTQATEAPGSFGLPVRRERATPSPPAEQGS